MLIFLDHFMCIRQFSFLRILLLWENIKLVSTIFSHPSSRLTKSNLYSSIWLYYVTNICPWILMGTGLHWLFDSLSLHLQLIYVDFLCPVSQFQHPPPPVQWLSADGGGGGGKKSDDVMPSSRFSVCRTHVFPRQKGKEDVHLFLDRKITPCFHCIIIFFFEVLLLLLSVGLGS